MTDNTRFANARLRVLGEDYAASGIGTLSERAVHRMLKLYIEPDEALHERPFLGSVADIMRDDGIYEIQTRSAERLVPKLERFLKEKPVTVVFPVTVTKELRALDKRTDEISAPRKSPKKESVYTAFRSIYKIRRFLDSPNLKIMLVLIEAEQYTVTDLDGKKHKSEKIPTKLVGTLMLENKKDFLGIVPRGLPPTFGSSDFAKAAKINKSGIFYVMRVLTLLGITECIGKSGSSNIYKLSCN